jgi:hypothetical protein
MKKDTDNCGGIEEDLSIKLAIWFSICFLFGSLPMIIFYVFGI